MAAECGRAKKAALAEIENDFARRAGRPSGGGSLRKVEIPTQQMWGCVLIPLHLLYCDPRSSGATRRSSDLCSRERGGSGGHADTCRGRFYMWSRLYNWASKDTAQRSLVHMATSQLSAARFYTGTLCPYGPCTGCWAVQAGYV